MRPILLAILLAVSCVDTGAIVERQRSAAALLDEAIAARASVASDRAELYRRRCRDAAQTAIDAGRAAAHGHIKAAEAEQLEGEAQRQCQKWRSVQREELRDLAAPAPAPDLSAPARAPDAAAPSSPPVPPDGGPHVG